MTAEEIIKEIENLEVNSHYSLYKEGYKSAKYDIVEILAKRLGEYAQQKQDKLELEILKQVKFGFDICSDHSTQCLGYHNLCRKIEELEQSRQAAVSGSVCDHDFISCGTRAVECTKCKQVFKSQ